MLVIPAIDIRDGKVVRLLQGDAARILVYGDDPAAWARRWIDLGAPWLHVVDLDGALLGRPVHLNVLRAICALGVPVQSGGGFRRAEDIEAGLQAGAARIIVGTAALDRELLLGTFGERVVVSLDVRGGRVAGRGWTDQTASDALDLARELEAAGIRRFIYTDIARDGMLTGANVEALRTFVASVASPVIAAGGINSAEDLGAVAATGVEGAIIGRAVYEGRIDLRAAVARGV